MAKTDTPSDALLCCPNPRCKNSRPELFNNLEWGEGWGVRCSGCAFVMSWRASTPAIAVVLWNDRFYRPLSAKWKGLLESTGSGPRGQPDNGPTIKNSITHGQRNSFLQVLENFERSENIRIHISFAELVFEPSGGLGPPAIHIKGLTHE